MDYYVTLFNSKYICRGLALYESIKLNSSCDFMLVVIAFDEYTYKYLSRLGYTNLTVVSLDEFEDEELIDIKPTRTVAEYCWTCTPKSILYVLNRFKCRQCTYLDADIFFYADPHVLLSEIPYNKSVMITEHRYTEEYDQTEKSGKYCVQFMTFKNTKNGLTVLQWWKDRCIEKCIIDYDNGYCGDQKYLDEWMTIFDSVYEMQNLGGGIAPWNTQQYTFVNEEGNIKYKNNETDAEGDVVFFHFHGMELFEQDVIRLCPNFYRLPDTVVSTVYKRYIRVLNKMEAMIKEDSDIVLDKSIYRDSVDRLSHDKNFYNYSLFI